MAAAVQRSAPRALLPPCRIVSAVPAAVLMTAALAGCGLGVVGEDEHGEVYLPTQGAGPYGKLATDRDTPAEEPYVVSEFRVHLRDPAVLRRPDGGFRLWFGRVDVADEQASEIWSTELPDTTERPDVAPSPALVADQPWEQGWVGAPSVLEMPDGTLVMFYQGGLEAPAIGRADSRDGALTWQKHPDNPLLSDAAEPAAALLPGGVLATDGAGEQDTGPWIMYLTRPGESGIFRADSADGLTWTTRATPVLLPRTQHPEAYDGDAVSDPFVIVRRTASGVLHYGMFFNGIVQSGEDSMTSIGWAGSFDGLVWHRMASPDEPVLAPGGTSEHAPAALLEPDRGILFFHEGRPGAQRIAVAVHP